MATLLTLYRAKDGSTFETEALADAHDKKKGFADKLKDYVDQVDFKAVKTERGLATAKTHLTNQILGFLLWEAGLAPAPEQQPELPLDSGAPEGSGDAAAAG